MLEPHIDKMACHRSPANASEFLRLMLKTPGLLCGISNLQIRILRVEYGN